MDDKYSRSHKIKIEEAYFERVLSGQKRFEIRLNDRDYQVGDWVYLVCGSREIAVNIIYITNFAQKDGYIVFGFTVGKENP